MTACFGTTLKSNFASNVFREHRLDDILMQCWEPLEQDCARVLPM